MEKYNEVEVCSYNQLIKICPSETDSFYFYFKDFFQKHPAPGAQRTIQQSLESIRTHSAWLARDKAALKALLSSY